MSFSQANGESLLILLRVPGVCAVHIRTEALVVGAGAVAAVPREKRTNPR